MDDAAPSARNDSSAPSQDSRAPHASSYSYPRIAGAILFVGCIFLGFLFHSGAGANAKGRLLTVYAVVEQHSFIADTWSDGALDKAVVGGHIYGDKAPLASFVATPFYAVMRIWEGHTQTDFDQSAANHIGIVSASTIPLAIFVLMLWRRLRTLAPPLQAVCLALASVFGTPLFNYGNVYFGHVLGGVLLMGCYHYAVVRERHYVIAGFLGGMAVLAEYPLALWVFGIGAYVVTLSSAMRRTSSFIWGGVLPALLLVRYNVAITGHLFDFPYSHQEGQFDAMRTMFGFRTPDLVVLWRLLFGAFRGMFVFGPPLIVSAAFVWRRSVGIPKRRLLITVLCVAHVLMVSSYFMWDGGWATGPRHLTPVMMILLYEGVSVVGREEEVWARRAFALLAVVGIAINLSAAAASPLVPNMFKHPLTDFILVGLRKGEVDHNNLLVELGLPAGLYLLAVWTAVFAAVALLTARFAGRRYSDPPVAPIGPRRPATTPQGVQ